MSKKQKEINPRLDETNVFKKVKTRWLSLEKTVRWSNTILLVLLFGSLVFAIIRAGFAPSSSMTETTKSQYFLIALQSLLGILALFIPLLLYKKYHLSIPLYLRLILVLFIYMAIFLGEMKNYYYKFQYWDTLLHTASGGIFALLGFSVINLLNDSEKIHMALSPAFIAFFSFCFAVTIGAVWEIYEFSVDSIFGLNTQKFMPEITGIFNGGNTHADLNGTLEEIGAFFKTPQGYKYALHDTMMDIVVDVVGAVVMSVVGYFILRKDKTDFDKFVIKKLKNENQVLLKNGTVAEQMTIEDVIKGE